MSLLTAIVMKVMIDLINLAVGKVKDHFGAKGGTGAKILLGLSAWAIMFGSKVVILLVIQIIFEDDVDLGGFFNVQVLVIAMMAARRLDNLVFRRLGADRTGSLEAQSADDPV